MCCGLAILALIGPRAAVLFWWLIRPGYFGETFSTILWPLLGFIFLPWVTLMYLVVAPGGLNFLDWLLLGLALVIDISAYGGSAYSQKKS